MDVAEDRTGFPHSLGDFPQVVRGPGCPLQCRTQGVPPTHLSPPEPEAATWKDPRIAVEPLWLCRVETTARAVPRVFRGVGSVHGLHTALPEELVSTVHRFTAAMFLFLSEMLVLITLSPIRRQAKLTVSNRSGNECGCGMGWDLGQPGTDRFILSCAGPMTVRGPWGFFCSIAICGRGVRRQSNIPHLKLGLVAVPRKAIPLR